MTTCTLPVYGNQMNRASLNKMEQVIPESPMNYLLIMYRALLSTAYFGLFRVGELTLSDHVIKVQDVKIAQNKDKVMFRLRTSKTHWQDKAPQIVKISIDKCVKTIKNTENNRMSAIKTWCPFQLLRDYINIRKRSRMDDEQFFVFRDKSPVKPMHLLNMLRKTLSMRTG